MNVWALNVFVTVGVSLLLGPLSDRVRHYGHVLSPLCVHRSVVPSGSPSVRPSEINLGSYWCLVLVQPHEFHPSLSPLLVCSLFLLQWGTWSPLLQFICIFVQPWCACTCKVVSELLASSLWGIKLVTGVQCFISFFLSLLLEYIVRT